MIFFIIFFFAKAISSYRMCFHGSSQTLNSGQLWFFFPVHAHTWPWVQGLIQKPAVKLDELPERAHCTVTGVSTRRRLREWSWCWELGSRDELSQCAASEPGELTETVSQGETRLETGELGGAYTKAAVKKKR